LIEEDEVADKTVRIDQETWEAIRELAHRMDEPMHRVLASAVEAMRRQYILQETNAAYAALRDNPVAWEEEQQERREWEATLADNLDEK
jgi:predicted transcriptional regulator